MGNVCCTGRTPRKSSYESCDDFQKSMEKAKNKQLSKSQIVTSLLKRTNLFPEKKSKRTVKERTEEDLLEISPIIDEENKSERTSSEYSQDSIIEYDLNSVSELSSVQQNMIYEILEKYKENYGENLEELADGITEVTEYTQDSSVIRTMMLTTFAIYLFEQDDFSKVTRRIQIDTILFFWIAEGRLSVLFQVEQGNNNEGNLIISSPKMEDILRAIEDLSFESTKQFIPWYTEGALSLLRLKRNKVSPEEIFSRFYNQENMLIAEILIKHGKIGENVLYFEPCYRYPESSDFFDTYFLMTDLALYSLNIDHKFKVRVALNKITKIGIDRKYEAVIIIAGKSACMWMLPIYYSEYIKKAVQKQGNFGIDVEWFDDDAYLNSRFLN
ncbi:unnamed protein product [Blepharisma stoltei]|uniref:Uncharacterized protein n=1 Tax=Blepharisma stoltei TaxID=1481888 RepID=A0AAU9JLT9_9CILI|nr:unnamed protein product [Blepharisma stoltei]